MGEFEIGDIVMLRNPNKLCIGNQDNLYKIEKVIKEGYLLEGIREVINKTEVLPVSINSLNNTKIRFIPASMADIIDLNNPKQEIRTLPSESLYYMDVINNDVEWKERTKELKYIHEIQRYFRYEVNPSIDFRIEQ